MLSSHESEIKIVAAWRSRRSRCTGSRVWARAEPRTVDAGTTARSHYSRFLAITAVNPLTIASFAAVAAALSLDGPAATIAFVAGVGAASAAWHLVLTLAAGHAGPLGHAGIRRGLAIGGRLLVLAIAIRLALGG